jgi:hypothetical protein
MAVASVNFKFPEELTPKEIHRMFVILNEFQITTPVFDDIRIRLNKECYEELIPTWSKYDSVHMLEASIIGNMDVVNLLNDNAFIWSGREGFYAALYGNYDVFVFTHKLKHTKLTPDLFNIIAHGGNVKIAEYAIQNKCKFNNIATKVAALHGNIEFLEYMYNNHNITWHPETIPMAVKAGHIECLKFAHKNKCPFGSLYYDVAIQNNRTECIDYMLENKFPIHLSAFMVAITYKKLDYFKKLLQHLEHPESVTPAVNYAGRLRNPIFLKWLNKAGVPFSSPSNPAHFATWSTESIQFITKNHIKISHRI